MKKKNIYKEFIADNLRLLTMGMYSPYPFEDILVKKYKGLKNDSSIPRDIFTTIGDSSSVLDIVVAVLGVINNEKHYEPT